MKTKKIVIKSTSGFCPVDYAYSDKLTIMPNSIAYELSLILRMTIHSMRTRSGHIKRRTVFSAWRLRR